eukprot:1714176-Pyramimonas_sp.AAC.1
MMLKPRAAPVVPVSPNVCLAVPGGPTVSDIVAAHQFPEPCPDVPDPYVLPPEARLALELRPMREGTWDSLRIYTDGSVKHGDDEIAAWAF